jgi:G patch domain-containing protein 1
LSKPKAKPEDPAEAAAKLGMFGPLTRSVITFYPTRLLCKRFDVSMPMHEVAGDSGSGNGRASAAPEPGFAATQFKSFTSAGFQHKEAAEVNQKEAETPVGQQAIPSSLKSEPEVVDPDRNEALEQDRPGLAVFKAIFGSDDEDD